MKLDYNEWMMKEISYSPNVDICTAVVDHVTYNHGSFLFVGHVTYNRGYIC